MMSNANATGPEAPGRSLTVPIPPPRPARLAIAAPTPPPSPPPPPAASPHVRSHSPAEDYIPILHQPVLKYGKTPAKTPTLVIVPPPSPSEGDFTTPVTPSPSPRSRGFKRIRVSQLPRDALGIATAGFTRKKSQRGAVDEYDDTAPLSPPYDDAATHAMDAQQVAGKAKPKRKTLFGLIEGWWDLGLLERGRSLRRK